MSQGVIGNSLTSEIIMPKPLSEDDELMQSLPAEDLISVHTTFMGWHAENNRRLTQLHTIATLSHEVMTLLDEDGASIVPYLIDTDENVGQRLRDALKAIGMPVGNQK